MGDSRAKYSSTTGRVAEERFVRAARAVGLKVSKSSDMEDMHDHVDYWLAVEDSSTKWGVDVKGNNLPDEIWCEFKNVRGNDGWLYGRATIIAFDMPEEGGFAIVNREDLAEYCEMNVSDEIVQNKANAHLKKYQRNNRQDLITKLKLQDIKKLKSYRVWDYFNKY